MEKRTLGYPGIQVSPLALGGNVFGWTIDEAQSFKILDGFFAAGGNLIDTADVYSRWAPGNQGGESETIIGKWMRQRANRKKIVIATKVGIEMGPNQKGLSQAYILQAVENSLRRLQTDYIDLYQSHVEDPDTAIEETLDAYAQLIREGKVRLIGASNHSTHSLASALEASQAKDCPAYQTLQPHYNLSDRAKFEFELEPLCLEKKLSVLPYYSLASGFLTGKYRSEKDLSKSPRGQGVAAYLNPKGFRILNALDQVAKQTRSKPASVALAWLMARPSVTAPIASATHLDQLEDLIAATQLKLSTGEMELLNEASDPQQDI